MSSTDTKTSKRLNVALAGVIMGATCVSSLAYTAEAQAQSQVVESEAMVADPTLTVAVVTAGFVAYGWLADKVYDLGKEVGKWAAGSTQLVDQEALVASDADYLLN
jgi:hypothetical protein